jgi:hypothetical protein
LFSIKEEEKGQSSKYNPRGDAWFLKPQLRERENRTVCPEAKGTRTVSPLS